MRIETIGIDAVLKNFSKEISKIRGNVQKGLTLGALRVKAESVKRTPVEFGNLRASHYVIEGGGIISEGSSPTFRPGRPGVMERIAREHPSHLAEAVAESSSKSNAFVEIGCTAFYAIFVHENLEARHVVGEAKFLENAIRQELNNWLGIIERFAKV